MPLYASQPVSGCVPTDIGKEANMLVISRRSKESFNIGSNIRVEVLFIRGKQVRIGIKAPKELKIWRDELADSSANNTTSQWHAIRSSLASIRNCFRSNSRRQRV
jgi:carbon storage regulator